MGNMMIDGGGGRPRTAKKATTAKKANSPVKAPATPWTFDAPQAAANNPGPALRPNPGPSRSRSRSYSAPSTGGGGGLGTGATGTVAAQAAAPPPMSQDQWLAQDASFIDEKNAATSDFENLMAKLAQQRTDFELDNKNTNRNLGWDGKSWNQDDRLTGYGNAFQNQLNDFSSRGMVDSSLYGEAQNDLNRGFNQQRDDLATQLGNFLSGQATDKAAAGTSRDQAITAAQRQALQRMAAQQSLGI